MTESPELFLIDANSLITPFLTFYPFDFARQFWSQIENHIGEGKIIILDQVKDEIECGKDALADWVNEINIGNCIDHRDSAILSKYAEILEYIRTNPCYKTSALTEWSKSNVADPWLIATSIIHGFKIITFEVANKGLNPGNPSKNAKIPDVSSAFGVQTENLYYIIRKLGITI